MGAIVPLAHNRKSAYEKPGEWVLRGLVYLVAGSLVLCAIVALTEGNWVLAAVLFAIGGPLAAAGSHAHVGEVPGHFDLTAEGWLTVVDKATLRAPLSVPVAGVEWIAFADGPLLAEAVRSVVPEADLGTWDMGPEDFDENLPASLPDWIPLGESPGAANVVVAFSHPQRATLRRDKLQLGFFTPRSQQLDFVVGRLADPPSAAREFAAAGISIREAESASFTMNWNSVTNGFPAQRDRMAMRASR